MADHKSYGQKIFHDLNVRQCSCIPASSFTMPQRLEWTESFTRPSLRGDPKRVKDSSMLLVITQECDIAARKDEFEPVIEIVICKKIKEKDTHIGNLFLKSTRKLQFNAEGTWYEANSEYILSVEKKSFFEALVDTQELNIITLQEDYKLAIPLWRANKYQRTALPDFFNDHFFPAIENHINGLVERSRYAAKYQNLIHRQ